jgi:CRISPR/Cas system CMR subunit Cmr4 (Cas7 group RAMP superfamily)
MTERPNAMSENLSGMSQELPLAVRMQIEQTIRLAMADAVNTISKRLEEGRGKADKAVASGRNARWLIIPAAIVLALWMYVPSPFSLQHLREEKAKLTKEIAKLRQSGANADVITCDVNGEVRFCAKIDSNARGDWDGYQIIQNK